MMLLLQQGSQEKPLCPDPGSATLAPAPSLPEISPLEFHPFGFNVPALVVKAFASLGRTSAMGL